MASLNKQIVLITSAVVATITLAFAVERYFSIGPERPLGHSAAGHVVGWIGMLLIALAFTYPLRKRLPPRAPWSKSWFNVHQACGVAGPALIFVHSGVHLHALVPVLALIAMVLVVLSGLVGLVIHYALAQSLSAQRRELTQRGLTNIEIEQALHALVADVALYGHWRWVHGPLSALFITLTILHVTGALYFGGG